MKSDYQWDFFISHASEDKDEIARPLAEILKALGFKIWYDEFILKVGDNLAGSLDIGLKSSRFGIVVLSPTFFNKYWPNRELDGLITLDSILREGRILPIAHQVSHAEIANFSLLLANTIYVSSSIGIDNVIRKLLSAVENSMEMPDGIPKPARDLIMRHEFYNELSKIGEFEENLTYDDSNVGYDVLVAFGQNTQSTAKGILSSDVILDVVRRLFIEELERPEEKPFTPFDLALYGYALYEKGHSKQQIEQLRKSIRTLDEYQEKHPEAKIPPTKTTELNKITSGSELLILISKAYGVVTEPLTSVTETEEPTVIEFMSYVADWLDIAFNATASEIFHEAPPASSLLRQLEALGIYVYAAISNRIYCFNDNTTEDWPTFYLMLTRHDRPSVTVLEMPPQPR